MKFSLHSYPWLKPVLWVLALASWALAAGSAASEAYEGPWVFLPWVSGAAVGVFFIASFLLALGYNPTTKAVDAEILLRNILVGGLLTLSIVLLSQLFPAWGNRDVAYFFDDVYPLIASLPLVLYLTRSFAALQHLLDEKTVSTRVTSRWFAVIVGISAAAAIYPMPDWVLLPLLALVAIPSFSLLFRVRWIGELPPNSRLFVFAYLFLITWVHLGLLLWFVVEDAPGIFYRDVWQNPFVLLLLVFNGAYACVSLLAVLFNWPMTAIIERRNNDIFGFQSLHEQISHKGSAEDIQELLLDLCYRSSGAQAAWFTRPVGSGNQVQYIRRGEVALDQINRWERELRTGVLDNGMERDGHLYVRNTVQHGELSDMAHRFRSALTFPMAVNGQHEGSLVLLRDRENAFDDYSVRMLGTYVNQARLALEKNRLVAQAVENERLKNEFEIATRVQESLLPRRAPQRSWLSFAVDYRPAQEVGGDCYDFFEEGEALHVVMGDVSGKGMGAAFNVAELKGIFHSNLDFIETPEEYLVRVNRAVSACFESRTFLTLVYLTFRPLQNEFVYARAGHCPILYYRASDKSAVYLEDKGLGLGIIRDDKYRNHVQVNTHPFDSNDIIVLFTDGIMEAQEPDTREEYGLERLSRVVARHAFFSAEEIKAKILDDVQAHLGSGRAGDDITLMVIKFQ